MSGSEASEDEHVENEDAFEVTQKDKTMKILGILDD